MKIELGHCYRCGHPIRFVVVGGVIRPLHKSGTVCVGAKRRPRKAEITEPLPFPVVFPPAFETPVQRHRCACRIEETFLVQHKDGFLDFDRLDWPWQRHICARTTIADYGVDHLRRKMSALESLHPSLALVAGAHKGWGINAIHLAAVQELGEGGSRFCLRLKGQDLPPALKQRERIEAGGLVGLCKNGEVRQLVTTSGFEFECLDAHQCPEELGIPLEWIYPEAILI